MPIYEYRCAAGHGMDRLRSYRQRDSRTICPRCGKTMTRIFSAPHVEPDGVYSYAPNIGSAEAFERRQAAIRDRANGGRGIIEKQDRPRHEE